MLHPVKSTVYNNNNKYGELARDADSRLYPDTTTISWKSKIYSCRTCDTSSRVRVSPDKTECEKCHEDRVKLTPTGNYIKRRSFQGERLSREDFWKVDVDLCASG